jgi:hypothetical protein
LSTHDAFFALTQQVGLVGSQTVNITVSKTVGSGNMTVNYIFDCEGVPCSSRTITANHLSFDNEVDFSDVTTVAFQGTISIAGTKQFNTAGNPCPIEGATVCARNHFGIGEQLVCQETNLNGSKSNVLGI